MNATTKQNVTRTLEIANTIRQQLYGMGKVRVWSWGSHAWTAINNGLSFKVQGFKFKGVVRIVLMPSDTYKIEFVKSNTVVKECLDVFFDEMVNVIDDFVEYTGANYENDVNNAVYKF